LYLNQLDTVKNVEGLVGFYVDQHNSHMPHSAFDGQTPDARRNVFWNGSNRARRSENRVNSRPPAKKGDQSSPELQDLRSREVVRFKGKPTISFSLREENIFATSLGAIITSVSVCKITRSDARFSKGRLGNAEN
jgi:hypothetical protein